MCLFWPLSSSEANMYQHNYTDVVAGEASDSKINSHFMFNIFDANSKLNLN